MDSYEKDLILLTKKLTSLECGNIRSVFGLLDLIYSLAEETTRRIKNKKFSPEFKKALSIRVLGAVTNILYSKNLISQELYEKVKNTLVLDNINIFVEYLEDISDIWLDNLQKHCLCFSKNNNGKLKKLRKLK